MDRKTLGIIFMTIFFTLSAIFGSLAQGNIQSVIVELQTQTISYMPFLVQQNLFLMETTTSKEPVCNNMQKMNTTLIDLQKEAEEIYNKSVSGAEKMKEYSNDFRLNNYISLILFIFGILSAIYAIYPKRK